MNLRPSIILRFALAWYVVGAVLVTAYNAIAVIVHGAAFAPVLGAILLTSVTWPVSIVPDAFVSPMMFVLIASIFVVSAVLAVTILNGKPSEVSA